MFKVNNKKHQSDINWKGRGKEDNYYLAKYGNHAILGN